MNRHTRFCSYAAFFALFFSAASPAQEQSSDPWVFNVEGGALHQTEVDLGNNGDEFAVDRWFLGAGLTYGWSPRDSFGVSVGVGRSIYEFGDSTSFGGGDPWGTVEDARVSATWQFGIGNTGVMFVVPTVRFNGEDDASSSDSTTYGLFAAAAWRLSETLTIGPGIGVFSRLEDSARVFPILAIDWNITDRWSLSTGRGLAASQGPGLTLGYELNDDWSLGLAGRYEDVEFRLDDKGVAPGGVGRDQSFPLVFTAVLEPNPMLRFSVFAGIEFSGEMKLKDATGKTIEESSYDPAPVFGATFDVRF